MSLAIGNIEDAASIFAVLAFNAGLGTYQERKAESAAAALKQVMRVTARASGPDGEWVSTAANWCRVTACWSARSSSRSPLHIASMFIPGWQDVLEIEPVAATKWLRGRDLAASINQNPAGSPGSKEPVAG